VVSIPHRYGKNPETVYAILQAAKFPFLIGTVRTLAYDYLKEVIPGFPFLIGTVRTYIIGKYEAEEARFHSS